MPMPRFQFSLRTLLIVVTLLAIPCGWLGWQAKIVRDRKAMMARIREAKGGGWTAEDVAGIHLPKRDEPRFGWVRDWLGDVPIRLILIPPSSEPKDDEIRRVFPEASIMHE